MNISIDRRRFTLALVAVGASSGSPSLAFAQARVISGSVTYRERMALPDGATLNVSVLDLGANGEAATKVTSSTLSEIGQVPISFEIELEDEAHAHTGDRLAIDASITHGDEVLFSLGTPRPLTDTNNVGELLLSRGGGERSSLLPEIAGAEWTAVEIGGQPVELPRAPTLTLNEDGTAGGHAGCNRYFATVTVSGDAITFSEIGSTFMACDEPVMMTEQAFLAALVRAVTFQLVEGRLELLDEDTRPVVALLVAV